MVFHFQGGSVPTLPPFLSGADHQNRCSPISIRSSCRSRSRQCQRKLKSKRNRNFLERVRRGDRVAFKRPKGGELAMWPMKTAPASAGKSSTGLWGIARGSEKVGGWKQWVADRWSQSVVAPGLDLLYEGLHRDGAVLTLFGSLLLRPHSCGRALAAPGCLDRFGD
jgi:hypothetical protein